MKVPAREDELLLMQSPDQWPLGDRLPVKCRSKSTGMVYYFFGELHNNGLPIVYPSEQDPAGTVVALPRTYSTWQQLIDDGWLVD